jgi:hypothetical protein
VSQLEMLPRYLLEGLWKTTKPFSQNSQYPAEIRTRHLRKTRQELYRLEQLARYFMCTNSTLHLNEISRVVWRVWRTDRHVFTSCVRNEGQVMIKTAAVQSERTLPTIRRYILPPSWGYILLLLSWKRRQNVPPKRCESPTSLHCVTSRKTAIFIVTYVRTSNLATC